jgi:hypothetical protein
MIENFEDIKIGDLLSLDPKSLGDEKGMDSQDLAFRKVWNRDNIAIVSKIFSSSESSGYFYEYEKSVDIEIIWLINPGCFQNP